ncbi:MAG: hypothetical protein L6R41_001826 [Letrouitia leprolyta]|nr:MAG: hypothetical protein L6R41_001826 [Letrouitia leprolyta]
MTASDGRSSNAIAISSTSARDLRSSSKKRGWIVYGAEPSQTGSDSKAIDTPPKSPPAAVADTDLQSTAYSIPFVLKDDPKASSICFFFRHYGGTTIDPKTPIGFNQFWRPIYLQASPGSPFRLATTAITMNIAMMWSSRGFNTPSAADLFVKAVAAARRDIHDPLQSLTDEMLMTILLFDLYDSLALHYAPNHVGYGRHKYGALAVIEQRGPTNLATSRGRALVKAVRHTLLPYLLTSRQPFPERLIPLFDHESINDTKATSLDQLSVTLSCLQSRQWMLHLRSRRDKTPESGHSCHLDVVEEALQLELALLYWESALMHTDYVPEYIPRDAIEPSIQDAGFYGIRCSVWPNLTIGSTMILFYFRYLLTLQIIRQSFADQATLPEDSDQQALLSQINDKGQHLVDLICEAIPFYLGDTVTPKNPLYSASMKFPHVFKTSLKTGITTRVPSMGSNHQTQASASGGWILFPHLVNLWRLAEPEDDAVPFILRDGQLDWIKGQVKRMQNIFLFCEPVWFKRSSSNSSDIRSDCKSVKN